MAAAAQNKENFDGFFADILAEVCKANPYNFKAHMPKVESRVLSNFWSSETPFAVRGFLFYSAETAFQFFLRDSKLSHESHTLWLKAESEPQTYFCKSDMKIVTKHYERNCRGVVSKLIVGESRGGVRQAVGISLLGNKKSMPPEALVELWQDILLAKFQRKGTLEHRVLLETRGRYLVEMDTKAKEDSFWSGYVSKDGSVERGYNFMGKNLMLVRKKLLEE